MKANNVTAGDEVSYEQHKIQHGHRLTDTGRDDEQDGPDDERVASRVRVVADARRDACAQICFRIVGRLFASALRKRQLHVLSLFSFVSPKVDVHKHFQIHVPALPQIN